MAAIRYRLAAMQATGRAGARLSAPQERRKALLMLFELEDFTVEDMMTQRH